MTIAHNLEIIACHYWRTQLCYVLCIPWCATLNSFYMGTIPLLYICVPFHYVNTKAILLVTHNLQRFYWNNCLKWNLLPPLLWLRHMFMGLRITDHLNDRHFTAYHMSLILLWLGHSGDPMSWYKKRDCWAHS